jgi:hypothetical protein
MLIRLLLRNRVLLGTTGLVAQTAEPQSLWATPVDGSPNKKMLDNNTTLLVKFVESDQNMAIKSLDPVNCTRGRVVALPKHRNLTCGACLIAVAVHDLSDQRPSRQVLPCLNSAC